jgi:hypothetical protein
MSSACGKHSINSGWKSTSQPFADNLVTKVTAGVSIAREAHRPGDEAGNDDLLLDARRMVCQPHCQRDTRKPFRTTPRLERVRRTGMRRWAKVRIDSLPSDAYRHPV